MTNTQQVGSSLAPAVNTPATPAPGNSTTGGSGGGSSAPKQVVLKSFIGASTASLTTVMAGLAAGYTPTISGKLNIRITGYWKTNTIGDGIQISGGAFGTGAAPAAGAAATGTTFGGGPLTMNNPANANQLLPFIVEDTISGLALNTAVWIDLQYGAQTGGTVSVQNIVVEIMEVS